VGKLCWAFSVYLFPGSGTSVSVIEGITVSALLNPTQGTGEKKNNQKVG
jgi:hypothetical protein